MDPNNSSTKQWRRVVLIFQASRLASFFAHYILVLLVCSSWNAIKFKFAICPFAPIDLSYTKKKKKKNRVDNQQNNPATSKGREYQTHTEQVQQRGNNAGTTYTYVWLRHRVRNLQAGVKKAWKHPFCLIKNTFFSGRPRGGILFSYALGLGVGVFVTYFQLTTTGRLRHFYADWPPISL